MADPVRFQKEFRFSCLNQEMIMQVTLDDEQWSVSDAAPLMEVLAQVSDKAHAKGRIVTSLQVGARRLTDRDLTRALLAQTGSEVHCVQVMTQSMDQVFQGADATMNRYAAVLKSDGASLVETFRSGHTPDASFDGWLGRLADYLECLERKLAQPESSDPTHPLVSWVARLLKARDTRDWVGVADVLEYEVLTRLPG
jgi:hypothetical protein